MMAGVQNTLTFTSANWDTPQTVTVNAAQDDDAVNDAATIAHAVVDASSADEYDPVANVDLAVTVTDDDTAGITVTCRRLPSPWRPEGRSATYTVEAEHRALGRRGDQPPAAVSSAAVSEVTVADTDRRRRRRGPGGCRPHR